MGMTAHPKPKGWGDMLGPEGGWILDSVRIGVSGMKGESPYHYPKPSATPKRGGLFMFFSILGHAPGIPGMHRGAALDPVLCVYCAWHSAHTRCGQTSCACGPALAPPGERGGAGGRDQVAQTAFRHFGRDWMAFG
jgi:hypothetical protein